MSCTTQDSVNQLCLFGPCTNGFVFNVRTVLSGRCIWRSLWWLLSRVSMQHDWPRWLHFANCSNYKTAAATSWHTTGQISSFTPYYSDQREKLFIRQLQYMLEYSYYVYHSVQIQWGRKRKYKKDNKVSIKAPIFTEGKGLSISHYHQSFISSHLWTTTVYHSWAFGPVCLFSLNKHYQRECVCQIMAN